MQEEYDLIGIGFGPANLALSIALRESPEAAEAGMRFHFVERQAGFAWHSSLLLPGSQLQVSPMKDLATMRDPTSSYTFTNYLHQQGRLAAFINREASIPSRREWSAYLHWAAKRMDDVVSYRQEVVKVEPDASVDGQRVVRLRITTRDTETGKITVRFAKNITVAVGGRPVVPTPFEPYHDAKTSHIAHSCSYLPSLASMEPRLRASESRRLAARSVALSANSPAYTASCSTSMEQRQRQQNAPLRFAVIGSGQSAAEISLHLRKTFPLAHVSLIFRASALVPSDDSAFVNAMAFDPERTDTFWRAGDEERKTWLTEFRRTNYSVVRSDVLNELHTEVYDQEIELARPWPNADGPTTHGRLEIRPNTQVDLVGFVPDEDADEQRVKLTMRDLKYPALSAQSSEQVDTFDAVFLATGFKRGPDCMPFLKPLQHFFPRLDTDASQRKTDLGFGEEVDSFDALAQLEGDRLAAERLRQRVRGITRDYRLVSYSSDAFSVEAPSSRSIASKSGATSPQMFSGASTPRRGSDMSDSETLAESEDHMGQSVSSLRRDSQDVTVSDEARRLRGPKMEPSIYFLGGNEATHGLSDSLLSIVAHRAGELSHSLLKRQAHRRNTISASLAKGSSVKSSLPARATLKSLPLETLEEKVRTMRAV